MSKGFASCLTFIKDRKKIEIVKNHLGMPNLYIFITSYTNITSNYITKVPCSKTPLQSVPTIDLHTLPSHSLVLEIQ